MRSLRVVGDRNTVLAFALAGVPGRSVETADEAREAVAEVARDVRLAGGLLRHPVLLIVTRGVAERIRDVLEPLLLDAAAPLVLEIPGVGDPMGGSTARRFVDRVLGVRMKAPASSPASLVHAADRLAALIREQAGSEAAQILADARDAAARTMSAAEGEVESLHGAAMREGEERGRRKAAMLLSEGQAAYRRDWLWEREKLVREVLRRAQEELEKFPGLPDASRALVVLVARGLRRMPIGAVVVRVPPSYVPLLDDAARAELGRGCWSLEVVPDCVPGGGACLETVDGRLCFDGSFAARLRRQEVILRKEIAGELFFEEGRGAGG